MKIDKFILGIIGVVLLAYFFPEWGSSDSPIPLNLIGSIGISLIFFFYGLKLSPAQIKTGLKNWKLHILVQLSTFLVFPLIVLLFYPFMRSAHEQTLWLGFLFLAALPSTVSSSVVMVNIAKGNVPAAIFNASISGLIGIVITPLWMGLFMQHTATDFNLSSIYIKLITEILVPVALGVALQPYWGKFAREYSSYLTSFDRSIILLIIFKSFAESFEKNVFSSVDVGDLLLISVTTTALFYTVFFLTGFLADQLGFSPEDRITVQFCGSKKSLVHGTVFSKILFQHLPSVGIMLLPLMIFHALQLFIVSMIASKLAKRDIIPT